jgi:hypothetical protein
MATMDTVSTSLALLFSELIDGPRPDAGYMLNPGDRGLLRSLDALSAAAASQRPPSGGASIAAHVDHLAFGVSLMNRWSAGDPDPWTGADWAASWHRTAVTDAEWTALRARLRDETNRWRDALQRLREVPPLELNGVIGSVAHLAYHLGAIRQIDRSIRGPLAE